MALKNIPQPGFSDDDGAADPALTAALAAWQQDPSDSSAQQVHAALHTARLLVPVLAVPNETETGTDGRPREKTSDMAVPTLTAAGGRRALPAFTATETLARWRPDARPVAVSLRQALEALAQEQADTLVVDLAGPVSYQVTGAARYALAAGRDRADPEGDPVLAEALRALLAAEPAVCGAYLGPGKADSDGTLALALDSGWDTRAVVRGVAAALAEDTTLRSRLVYGLDLAVLPPGTRLPRKALYQR